MCHKLDAVADLTTVSHSKPDKPLYQLTSSLGGTQNLRCSLLMTDHKDLARQSGDDNDCQHAINTRPWSRTPGESRGALLSMLNRTAPVD